MASQTSAIGNPYLFNGQRWESDVNLYYYRNRYLDPQTGRFTTRDPLGIWGDPANLGNPYTYVGNNPTSRLDPFGLEQNDFWENWFIRSKAEEYLDEESASLLNESRDNICFYGNLSVIMFIGSYALKPLDIADTATDIIGDILAGNYYGAGIDMALAVLPMGFKFAGKNYPGKDTIKKITKSSVNLNNDIIKIGFPLIPNIIQEKS